MKRKNRAHSVDFLFPLSLFCIFTVCAFLVAAIGVGVYQRIAQNMEDTYSTGTAFSYVAEKIRQHDADGRISLIEMDGTSALLLTDEAGGSAYQTCIYPLGDFLCETVTEEGTAITPSEKDAVLEVRDFTIEETEGGFVKLSASDSSGTRISYLVHIQTGSHMLSEEEVTQP